MIEIDFKEQVKEKILSYKPDFNLEILDLGLEKFKLKEFKAGDFILKEGEKFKTIFIVEKSIIRSYFLGEDGEEKTMWISPRLTFLTEYESYSTEKMNRCNIRLYEDSSVYMIDREDLTNLYANYHEWALVGILIIEEHFINLLKTTNTIRFNDACKNYDLIESFFSQYLEIVPLKHLASWLNISAVHLSRIRANRSKNVKI